MKAKGDFLRRSVMWLAAAVLVVSAGMLLGGCHGHKTVVYHERGPYVARHKGPDRVVVVERAPRRTGVIAKGREGDRRDDRRNREEGRHDERDSRDRRYPDRHSDDQFGPRQR